MITLEKLPFDPSALEPFISAETLAFHYGKHHAGYVNKLNDLLKATPEHQGKSLLDLVMTSSGAIYNCAAQTWNHSFYWNSMAPKAGGEPSGRIKEAIEKDFGSFENFKKQFNEAAGGHFGSGWAWLVQDYESRKLRIVQTHDAGNPLREKLGKPILTCDVWEHAYYIDYKNDRMKYLTAWWSVVNWKFANANLLPQSKI